MNEMQNKDIEYIVKNYSFNRQIEQAIEEAAEFIKAAQKYKRYGGKERVKDFREETGDLLICMEQMRHYLGKREVDKVIDYKLAREILRIETRNLTRGIKRENGR